MTTSIPDHLAWPLLALCVVITTARYCFFNRNQYETTLNNTLILLVFSNVLRDRATENFLADHTHLTVTTSQQLSLVVAICAACEFMGFVTMWSDPAGATTSCQNFQGRAAAVVLGTGFFLAATPARRAGQTLEDFGGWWAVCAWVLLNTPITVMSLRMLRLSVREFRNDRANRRERILALGSTGIAVVVAITSVEASVLAAADELGLIETSKFRDQIHSTNIFWETVGACAIASVPFAVRLMSWSGLDNTSRSWRKLQPLLSSAIDAVPEIAFPLDHGTTGRQKTTLDLHQTIVQIRDGILYLRSWLRPIDPDLATDYIRRYSIPPKCQGVAIDALRLACAAQAKTAGLEPGPGNATAAAPSQSSDLRHETAEMLDLARWWSQAQSTARQSFLSAPVTEGST